MRKPYQKPELYAESFRLVEHISTGCVNARYNAKTNSGDGYTCYFDYGNEKLFLNVENTTCTSYRDEEDLGAPFECYNYMTMEVFAFVTS